jgi:hypothetical protein
MYLDLAIFVITNPTVNIFYMLSLHSSFIFLRMSKFFCLFGLIYLLQVSGLAVKANAATDKTTIAIEKPDNSLFDLIKKNPWSNIKGFRSAKFGMDEKSVYRAIAKDFNLAKSKVVIVKDGITQTSSLTISVPNLFSTGGTAKIGYVLGYKSKGLITVNVLWGVGAAEKINGQSVINTANLLRGHFLKKRYLKNKLAVNGKISNNQTIIFRGQDQKKRMVVVLLTTGTMPKGGNTVESLNKVSLLLSYVKDAENPDVRKISIKEDEF